MASFDFTRLQMGMIIAALQLAMPYTTAMNRNNYQELLDHVKEKLLQEE